jgi:alpha-beta hydrolase superfamily lysophospholipase
MRRHGRSARDRVPQSPSELGERDGLAYALFAPTGPPQARVVIIHGADSQKENHYPFARACRAYGLAAVAFDLRGHGASAGELDGRVLDDIATISRVAGSHGPLALRGSSLGGYLALLAAVELDATAVVAICPAEAEGLTRSLSAGRFRFAVDAASLTSFLAAHDATVAAASLRAALLLLHADGDEQVPIANSRILLDAAVAARSRRLIAVPGGHHRSVQRDDELQGISVRWLARAVSDSDPAAR